jgi:hypothetical protein
VLDQVQVPLRIGGVHEVTCPGKPDVLGVRHPGRPGGHLSRRGHGLLGLDQQGGAAHRVDVRPAVLRTHSPAIDTAWSIRVSRWKPSDRSSTHSAMYCPSSGRGCPKHSHTCASDAKGCGAAANQARTSGPICAPAGD